jgi:hypothetical protein
MVQGTSTPKGSERTLLVEAVALVIASTGDQIRRLWLLCLRKRSD